MKSPQVAWITRLRTDWIGGNGRLHRVTGGQIRGHSFARSFPGVSPSPWIDWGRGEVR